MYIKKGVAEKIKEKTRLVFYGIAMKNPVETLRCDFMEVTKLRHSLVAIQFCPDNDPFFRGKPSMRGLENGRGSRKSEQMNLISPTREVNSIGKIPKRVEKKHRFKQAPATTAILSATERRKINLKRRSRCHVAGPNLGSKPVPYLDEDHTRRSEAILNLVNESVVVVEGGGALEGGSVSPVDERKEEAPLSSSSTCLREVQESAPGWPLLRKAAPLSQGTLSKLEGRELSVVQWVMSLPNRSSPVIMQTQIEETDNSKMERISLQDIQTSLSKPVDGTEKDENLGLQAPQTTQEKSVDGCDNIENYNSGHLNEYKERVSLQQPMLGWPLLQKPACATPEVVRESILAREVSVVQWVMSLPDRNQIYLGTNKKKSDPLEERGITNSDISINDKFSTASGKPLKELHLLETSLSDCRWFSYEELKMATSQFSSENLIGEGGCSSVYKGLLPCGRPVAVKLSKSYKEVCNDFSQEINITTSLNHEHITPLIGVCVEDNYLISVYDFLARGSLEENLNGDGEKLVLPWEVRFRVAAVVAEALNYLHSQCSPPVIHRDIKSSNILLSNDFQPQISDFGLAIRGPADSIQMIHSDVVGTFGYIAPEYFMHGRVSDKIDIYSFGVVLLELISGRKPIVSQTSLVKWAKPLLESDDLKALVDPKLDGKFEADQMQRVVLAAICCINQSDELRPRASQILNLLQGEKDAEEWFKLQVSEWKKLSEKENDKLHMQLVSKPLLDVEGDTTSHKSPKKEREYFSLEDCFR